MGYPEVAFVSSGNKISSKSGFDVISVKFVADEAYQRFECRATKVGDPYGVGKGELLASFSTTPAGVERSFEIYDEYLLNGDGDYRISLYAQGKDGTWNDGPSQVRIACGDAYCGGEYI